MTSSLLPSVCITPLLIPGPASLLCPLSGLESPPHPCAASCVQEDLSPLAVLICTVSDGLLMGSLNSPRSLSRMGFAVITNTQGSGTWPRDAFSSLRNWAKCGQMDL